MVAFGLTLQASWEGVAVTFQASLLNGGPAAMVYGMILGSLGSVAIALSLGEMASMYRDILWSEPHILYPVDFLKGSRSRSSISLDGTLCSKIYETRVLESDTRFDSLCFLYILVRA
jgi:hypothetical protein